jgi:hypothetical protein
VGRAGTNGAYVAHVTLPGHAILLASAELQSESGASNMLWPLLAVPGPGSYKVDLMNVEPWFNATGQRLFSVLAEGNVVAANLDLFSQARGRLIATNNTFLAMVSCGAFRFSRHHPLALMCEWHPLPGCNHVKRACNK